MKNINNPEKSVRKEEVGTSKTSTIMIVLICIFSALLLAIIVYFSVAIINSSVTDETEVVSQDLPPVVKKKPAPEIPPASEQNDLLQIAIDAKGREEKACYLTFDDGPTEVTNRILDTLNKYDIKATFFMLGRMIEANPDIAKRVHDEGHLIANHSYTHTYKDLYATPESFLGEIDKTAGLIQNVIGEEPFKLLRFPGGSHNAGSFAAQKQQYKVLLKEKGYYYADWNSLNGDAESSATRTPEQLLARIKETSTQSTIVVLMHDAQAKSTTADALPLVIEYLKNQGYSFYRMDEIKYYAPDEKTDEQTLIM